MKRWYKKDYSSFFEIISSGINTSIVYAYGIGLIGLFIGGTTYSLIFALIGGILGFYFGTKKK